MSDETATTAPVDEQAPVEPSETEDQRVPYERFQQANKKAKDADLRAKALEKQMADLQARIDEREQAGLPELEQLKKRLEAADKRAAELEQQNESERASTARLRKEQMITAAAKDFRSPRVAIALLREHGEFDELETEQDIERALKRLVKSEGDYLLKSEGTPLPGRVLKDGKPPTAQASGQHGGINLTEEAQMVSESLKQFLKNR